MEYPEITKLYKYRSFSAQSISMLASDELYFAASFAFNDPFDCRARKEFEFADDGDFIDKMAPLEASHKGISEGEAVGYLERILSEDRKKVYLKEKSRLFQKLALQLFGICSFSEIPDDILMWSHYSDGHQGFCLEFERSPNNMLQWAKPIRYPNDDEFPYVDYWTQDAEEQIKEITKIVTTKSKHWRYEKEWRGLDRPGHVDNNYTGHIKNYATSMLSGVIFGARMPESARKVIRSVLVDREITFYDAKIVRNHFKVEIVGE